MTVMRRLPVMVLAVHVLSAVANASDIVATLEAADQALAIPENKDQAIAASKKLWQAGIDREEPGTQARGLIRMGWASLHFGDWGDHAGEWRREAEELVAALPNPSIARAEVLMFEGYLAAYYHHRFADGIRQIRRSITIGRTLSDDRFLAKAFYLLGRILPYDGQSELGYNCLHRSALFAKQAGMPAWEHLALLGTVRFGSGRTHDEAMAARRAQLRKQLGLPVPFEDLPTHERLAVAVEQMKAVDYPAGQRMPSKLEDIVKGLTATKFLAAHYLKKEDWKQWDRALLAARHAAAVLQDGTSVEDIGIERAAGLARQGKVTEAIERARQFIASKEGVENYQALARATAYIARQMGEGGNEELALEWFVKADEYQQKAFDRRLNTNRNDADSYYAEEVDARRLLSDLDSREAALARTRATTALVVIAAVLLAVTVWYWQRERQHKLAESRLQGLVDEQTESLRVAKESAENANRAKTDFLARVNHELRNPLTAIVSSCEILGDCIEGDPVAEKCGETITACTQGLVDVIDEILDFTQIESGELTLRAGEFSPREVLSTVRAIVEPKLVDGVELQVLVDPEMPKLVRTDQAKLRQVLLNLAVNAARHTESGSVRLECRLSNKGSNDLMPRLMFVVADTGCGMSASDQETLFTRYRTYSERSQTGLGLYISQGFVRCLGGKIDCSSEVGQGTTFTVQVPFSAVEHQPRVVAMPAKSDASNSSALSFLVIDDEAANRDTIEILLSRMGHDVTTAEVWDDAKATLNAGSIDVVLLDLRMPRVSGYEVIERIRALRLAQQPDVFAMTGDATQATRDKTIAAGFSGFLAKPFRVNDLRALLDSQVSSRRAA